MISVRKLSSQNRVPPGDAAPAAPSANPHRPPAGGAASFSLTLQLSEPVQVLLAVVAAHDRTTPEAFIGRAVCARAEEIGIQNLSLTDGARTGAGFKAALQGGEVASRLAHNQEVARSNRAPATRITPERASYTGGGNPAAPEGGDAARAPP